jgi:hypothetical protein
MVLLGGIIFLIPSELSLGSKVCRTRTEIYSTVRKKSDLSTESVQPDVRGSLSRASKTSACSFEEMPTKKPSSNFLTMDGVCPRMLATN